MIIDFYLTNNQICYISNPELWKAQIYIINMAILYTVAISYIMSRIIYSIALLSVAYCYIYMGRCYI